MVDIVLNKRRLFILGASSFGRELESWLRLIPDNYKDWEIAGYLDKDFNALDGFPSDYKVIGEEDSFDFKPSDLVILGIADPLIKRSIYKKLQGKVSFYTYIAPNAVIGKFNIIEEGSIICPNVVITTNVIISKCTTINLGAYIGHDVKLDPFVSIMPNVDLGGFVSVGEGAFLGTKTTVIPSKRIGAYAFIGAGSVVIRNVQEGDKMVGNPARKL
ncbi:MAG: acetyltransferase [Salinivirgaceae bacterium]|jgi:sugar O-acyltransferase (sialic acid O-acetyltransferase NeuD family)